MRRLILCTLGGIGLLALFLAWALDRYGRRGPPDETFDAIVVLGCRVHADGTPSTALRERTRRAVELWKEGRAPKIVLTGGIGDHPPAEAKAEEIVARELGVPVDALLLEDQSTSTEENARFASERFGGRSVLIVSDAYHVFRAERVFARYYERVEGTGTVTLFKTRAFGSLREVIACSIYLGLGRMGLGFDGMSDPPNVTPLIDPRTPTSAMLRRELDRACVASDDERHRRRVLPPRSSA